MIDHADKHQFIEKSNSDPIATQSLVLSQSDESKCGICLCDTEISDMVKAGIYIDDCMCVNIYHPDCLNQWFEIRHQITCPVCKRIGNRRVHFYSPHQTLTNNSIDIFVDKLAKIFEIWINLLFTITI